ncbi:hypothetical protein GCM10011385_18410 [Nitratireductor aestuarii]|uniref:Type 3 secretion system stator protein n=1 Tax=Nitratireductor aestuarii TaxID=1735103 RepID=A0A916RPX1_9HYPH|nr:type III secretion system stator protein SctL [Nitratireductor aestuarii]GGA64929.1 hypothetical protein GCM10011385_18410 [Nitratireductor aestuarii]
MVTYRLRELGFSLAAGSHILSPDAAEELHEAASLLEVAEQQAARIMEEAEVAFDIQKARGHAEGRREAEEQAAARLIDETHLLAGRLQALETEVVNIVIDCVRQILHEYDDRDLAQSLVHNALQRMRSEKTVQLRVPPSRVKDIRASTDQLLREFAEIELIDVVADDRLELHRLVVESPTGRIDLDLEQGVERLRSIFQNAASGIRDAANA